MSPLAGFVVLGVLLISFLKPAHAFAGDIYYWIQPLAKHPQHQLTRAAFLQRCKELQITCEAVGTEENDVGETLRQALDILDGGNVAGMSIWIGGEQWQPLIDKAASVGVPVILAHGSLAAPKIQGITAVIGGDPIQTGSAWAAQVAPSFSGKAGTIAVTQGSFNDFENAGAAAFADSLKKLCPDISVLSPVLEGFDSEDSVAIASSLILANPDLVGAFSTTALGAQTWTFAQRKTGKSIVVVGGNQLGNNLNYVKSGEVFAVGWSPFIEVAQLAADLLQRAVSKAGPDVTYHNTIPRYLITQENVDVFTKKHSEHLESLGKID
jgi:ABC-type sugar transport system substrate-binding protein